MPQLMLNRQPMAFGAVWDEANDAYFYLAPRNPKKPFLTREKPKRFTTDPFFGTHVINAYEVPEEVNSENEPLHIKYLKSWIQMSQSLIPRLIFQYFLNCFLE